MRDERAIENFFLRNFFSRCVSEFRARPLCNARVSASSWYSPHIYDPQGAAKK